MLDAHIALAGKFVPATHCNLYTLPWQKSGILQRMMLARTRFLLELIRLRVGRMQVAILGRNPPTPAHMTAVCGLKEHTSKPSKEIYKLL